MTPQELKNSILQLAIQGKLVEHRPEEGTAEEFFQEIQKEKRRLIKEGKIKKEKPFPEITEDDVPFDIPESWKWVRLQQLASTIVDCPHSTPPYYNHKTNFCAIDTNCIDSSGSITMWRYVDETTYLSRITRLEPKENDIVYTREGSICRAAILPSSTKICLGQRVMLIRCPHNISPRYLQQFLMAPQTVLKLAKAQKGIGAKHINVSDVCQLLIPLPPLTEQKRIVAKIEEFLPYIDRYEQAWNRLEEFNKRFPVDLQKSILQMAIQGNLVEHRPEEGTAEELYQQIQFEKRRLIKKGKIKKEKPLPEITENEMPFDIPDSWKWVRIADITWLNPKNDLDDNLKVSFIPMALISDGFQNNHSFEIRQWKEIKKGFTHFSDGDVGIAKITPCFQNRKSVIFSELKNGYGAGTTELSIVRVIGDLFSREYLLYFFKSAYFIDNGVKSFTGTAGQQRIHKDYLSMCPIPLPPLAEQKRIVAKLEELLPLCERLK